MQRSTLTLVVVLALILGSAGLWWSLQGGSARRGADVSDPRTAGQAESTATPVDLKAAQSSERADPAPATEALEVGAVQREAVPTAAEAAPRPTIELRVVDGATGQPVEGASVFVRYLTTIDAEVVSSVPLAPEQVSQEDVDRWDGPSLDELVAGLPALKTGAKGLVSIPAPLGGTTVAVARDTGRWGRRVLDEWKEDSEEGAQHDFEKVEELVLTPDEAVLVKVVDPFGQPVAGVPVQIQHKSWNNWQKSREVSTAAKTGEARFEHVQLEVQKRERHRGRVQDEVGWRVAIEVVIPEPPSMALDPEAWPTEPVVFELQRGGTVVVEVFDPTGTRMTEGATVALGIVADGQSRHMSAFDRNSRARVEVALRGERTRFDHVAPGHELDVRVSRGGNRATHVFTEGPTEVGHEVSVGVTVGEDHPVVRVRLVDAEGEPLKDAGIELRTHNEQFDFGMAGSSWEETDETGHALIELDPGWTKGHVEIVRRGEELSAVLELDRELPNGLTDLGDLTLAETPLIVSGRAVGPAGELVAGAEVWLLDGGEDDWNRRWEYDTETDEAGAFELRGALKEESFRVQVQRDGYYARPVEFTRGTSGLVVQLGAAGAIVGAVLLDEDVPADLLEIRLDPAGEKPVQLSWRERQTDLEEDGSFRCDPLPAGVYDVQLKLEGSQETVHEVKGVAVEAGDDTRDPSLAAIDLRGALHAFKLTIEGVEGDQQMNGTIRLGEAGAEELKSRRWFNKSEVFVVAPHRVIDVDVEVAGFRTASLRSISGDARVELERGANLRVVLVGDGEPLSSPYGLSVGFAPLDDTSGNLDWSSPRFDERREIVVRATTTGAARVRWIVEQSSGGGGMATSTLADPEQVVHLTGESGEQRVEVRLSKQEAERLQKLLGDF